ncbi:MAG TPA: hypothetical protein VF179_00245 [Thermoanaerobaculia bacterium]|nr:hypothetical protein [Thermoanaerobaculia bacterium]
MHLAYESDDLGQSLVVHSRLKVLLAQVELEVSRLKESGAKRSLTRRAVRRQKEIARALGWSTKLMEKKKGPTSTWAMLGGALWTLVTHLGMFSDDDDSWDRRLSIAAFLLACLYGYMTAWLERSSYERLLPRILIGMDFNASQWLDVQALEPE